MTHTPQYKDASNDELRRRLERAEHDLASLRDQLEHSHRLAMLGTLSAGVIHEINNILTPVLAYAQMVGSNPHDTELLTKVAKKTVRGISQATDIAESMLQLAQPGRAITELAEASVEEACRSALHCLGRNPDKDGIACTIDVPSDLTCAIRPLALQQVILNLLINAIEALKMIPAHQRQLTIRAWPQDGDTGQADPLGRTIRIEVADSGPGIPEPIRAKLFQPFVSGRRADSPNSTLGTRNSAGAGLTSASASGAAGTGLGLSVCRTLIEAAGGTISARSDSRTGTVFTIDLPQHHAQSKKLAS